MHQKSASAADAVKMTVHGLNPFELHFQIVDLVSGVHILEHITCQCCPKFFNLLFDGCFLFCCHDLLLYVVSGFEYKKVRPKMYPLEGKEEKDLDNLWYLMEAYIQHRGQNIHGQCF